LQDEWEDNRERILKQYGVEEFQQETLVVMPRRAGKTWSMAMFCAAMLLVCPDIEISVFATGQRTAGKLLKLIVKMLRRLISYVGDTEFKWLTVRALCPPFPWSLFFAIHTLSRAPGKRASHQAAWS